MLRRLAVDIGSEAEDDRRIDAEKIAGSQRQDDGADAHATAPDAAAEVAASAPSVFDIVAFILVIKSHDSIRFRGAPAKMLTAAF